MFMTSQWSTLSLMYGLCGWFIGHQSSHCFALRTGQVKLNPLLAIVMGIETFLGAAFLAWFAYMEGIYDALLLFALAFALRFAIVKIEHWSGLTQRAWVISITGIAAVPVLVAALVYLVLHPIS
jgi:hypothetical protein